jgi:hypothetical protein
MRAVFLLLPATLFSFVIVTVGCSTPSVEGDPPNVLGSKGKTRKDKTTTESEETDSADDEPVPPESSTTPPPSNQTGTDAGTPAPPPATSACAASTTRDACFTCCEQEHPQGIPTLQQAFGNCVCGNGAGNCAAECGASFCAGAAPSALCEQCLDAADTCRVQADTACEQTPACDAMFQCDTASQCANKP